MVAFDRSCRTLATTAGYWLAFSVNSLSFPGECQDGDRKPSQFSFLSDLRPFVIGPFITSVFDGTLKTYPQTFCDVSDDRPITRVCW